MGDAIDDWRYGIHTGDSLEVLQEMPADSVHAIVTDPPYGLAFMGRDWDDFEPKEYQEWCENWARRAKRVLKPGGHLLAFSGNRTHHRAFTGIEDAGFEIRDTLTWHYGSGFPKATDVSKTIDKRGGAHPDLVDEISEALKEARESRGITITEADEMFCGGSTNYTWFEGRPKGRRLPTDDTFREIADEWPELSEYQERVEKANREVVETKTDDADRTVEVMNGSGEYEVTKAATDAAKRWEGWKTGLKPATEYVVMARKPFDGATVDCVLEHGTGALNIDGTRVGTDGGTRSVGKGEESENAYGDGLNKTGVKDIDAGRYPSNVAFDEHAAADLDEQVGELSSGSRSAGNYDGAGDLAYGEYDDAELPELEGSSGGPSRYFYTSKATKSERTLGGRIDNAHPTVKPQDLMEWLVEMVTRRDQIVLDPFAGSGTTCKAAKESHRAFIGIEKDPKWADVARARCGLDVEDPDRVNGDDGQGTLPYHPND